MQDEKLVKAGGEWQICFRAKGKMEGRPVLAWLRKLDGAFHCEVGEEQDIGVLPDDPDEEFASRDFCIIIEEVDAKDSAIEHLGVLKNIKAAQAAFKEIVRHSPTKRILMMRKRARIMEREHGLGEVSDQSGSSAGSGSRSSSVSWSSTAAVSATRASRVL